MPRKRKGFIEDRLYRKILEVMPIACVDVVVESRGRFLLVKRAKPPARGQWWFPGGRVLKGERLYHTAARKAREDAGLNSKMVKFLATRETIFKDSAFGPSTHSVNSVFLVRASSSKIKSPNNNGEELKWFSRIHENWPVYLKDILKLAGFK